MRSRRHSGTPCCAGRRLSTPSAAARSPARSSPRVSAAPMRCRAPTSSRLLLSELLLRHGEWEQVTPESAGWRYLSFGVREQPFSAETGGAEIALVVLGGRCRVG